MLRTLLIFSLVLLNLTLPGSLLAQDPVDMPVKVEFRDAPSDRIRSDGNGPYIPHNEDGPVFARISGLTGFVVLNTCGTREYDPTCRTNTLHFDRMAHDLLGEDASPANGAVGLPFIEKQVQTGWTIIPLGPTARMGRAFFEELNEGPQRFLANLKLNFRNPDEPSILWTVRNNPDRYPDSESLLLTILGGSLDCENGCSTFTVEALNYSFPESDPGCCHTGQIEDVGTLVSQGNGIFDEGDYHLPFKMRVTVLRDESEPRHYYLPSVESGNNRFTGLAVSNPSDVEANLVVRAYGNNGRLVESRNQRVEEGRQWARLVSEVVGEGQSFDGWLEITSDNPAVGIFIQSGDSRLSTLDGVTPFESVYKKLYFLRTYEGTSAFRQAPATTMINIINPGEQTARAVLRIRTGTGAAIEGGSTLEIELPAKGALLKSLSELFGGGISSGYLELEVLEGDGLIAFQRVILTEPQTEFALKAAVWEDTGDQLYSGQFAQIPSVLFSSVRLLNTSPEQARVTLQAVDASGAVAGQPRTIKLGAGELLEQEVQQFLNSESDGSAPADNSEPFVGSLRISVERGGWGVLGDVVFGLENLDYAAASVLQNRPLTTTVFSHVASLPNTFFTGLAIFNPQTEPVVVEIECFAAEGNRTAGTQIELSPGQRISELVADLLPDAPEQVGGYLKLTASKPIVAQELFGTPNLSLLSAVQPTGE